jgi:probable addiction module antidote protein
MMPRSRSYKTELQQALQDPQEAAAYLTAALEDGSEQVFLLALRDVVDATTGLADLSEQTGWNRESLYKNLSERGNPHLSSIRAILDGLGLRLSVEASVPLDS